MPAPQMVRQFCLRASEVRRETAPNGAPGENNLSQNKGPKNASAPNGADAPPALLEGERAAGEKRKKLAILFAEQKLSNRKIAKALNVNEGTIRNDTAENSAPVEKNIKDNNGAKNATAENSAPALLGGGRAAKLITNNEGK